MSVVSTLYDAVGTFLGTTFPNHAELTNPYYVDLNDELYVDHAYGFLFSNGSNANLVLGCEHSIEREIQVLLTRKVFSGAQMRNSNSLAIRKEAEKNLFEDQITLIKAMTSNTTLGQIVSGIDFVSDDGIELVSSGKYDLLVLRSVFTFKYIESL